tara:strand:+ start:5794 stop:6603 length:810 start_codon:yes stop_codon:yes gene_type:complete
MAFRKIHDTFWTDPDIEDLTPEQKFFYLYLITNPSINQIGLYEFSFKRASFETGYNQETIEKLLLFFENEEKIKRSLFTKEILVVKFWHHNKSTSPKVLQHVNSLLDNVKDRSLIQYVYSMDTLSQEEKEEEEEKEKKKTKKKVQSSKKIVLDLIDFWNNKNGCSLKFTTKKSNQVKARLNTFSVDELKKAILNRSNDEWINNEGIKFKSDWESFWRNDEKVERYLHIQVEKSSEKNNYQYAPKMSDTDFDALRQLQEKYNATQSSESR